MQSNGLATFLLLIPVLTVPALAIFGIPQFAPVVASPLDEGRDDKKESRIGNSVRHSHDELFGDEDFGSEPEDLSPHRRNASGNGHRRSAAPRSDQPSEKSANARWGDDLASESDRKIRPGRQSSDDSEFESVSPPPPKGKSARGLASVDQLPRDRRREFQDSKSDGIVRVADAGLSEGRIVQSDFIENADFENAPEPARNRRTRSSESQGQRPREGEYDGLSWQRAVERLNEMEIRSFRLEPGQQLGQFIFICSYTPPDNPRVSYRFEAGADEPLKAVEKVLEQIVEWQKRR